MDAMSPDARLLTRLLAELRRDLGAAEQRLDGLRTRREQLADGDPVLASFFALSLHSYYTAIETAFERISRSFDGGVPTGTRSHQELLETMTLELPGIRPAVIKPETLELLRELLGFRHFVRHAYAVTCRTERLGQLVALASKAHAPLMADMTVFLSYVDALAGH